MHLCSTTEAKFSYKFLKNIKPMNGLFCTALWWRSNKALPCSGLAMACFPLYSCWSVLASASWVTRVVIETVLESRLKLSLWLRGEEEIHCLGHLGSVRETVLESRLQLSLWLQGEEEICCLGHDGSCFRQVKAVARCWCIQRVFSLSFFHFSLSQAPQCKALLTAAVNNLRLLPYFQPAAGADHLKSSLGLWVHWGTFSVQVFQEFSTISVGISHLSSLFVSLDFPVSNRHLSFLLAQCSP